MRNLAAAWKGIEKRLARAPAVAVATDFDGTLTPIRRSPGAVRLSGAVRKVLSRLTAAPGVTLAVVSGRSLRDLAGRVRLPRAVLIGNHGLESRIPGRGDRRLFRAAHVRSVRIAADAARRALRGVPGLRWEDKGPVVSAHVRLAPKTAWALVEAELRKAAAHRRPPVCVARNKSVFELRPALPVDKGRALLDSWRRLGVPREAVRWYFGDDATDEDVFRVLPGRRDFAVHVGNTSDVSAAHYVLHSTSDVRWVLAAILRARRFPPRASCRLGPG